MPRKTKKPSKSLLRRREYIKELMYHWMELLNLLPYNIEFFFVEKDDINEDSGLAKTFDIQVNYPYRNAIVRIFPFAISMPDQHLSQTILHEVMHIALDRLNVTRLGPDQFFDDAVEEVTEHLTMTIFDICHGGVPKE